MEFPNIPFYQRPIHPVRRLFFSILVVFCTIALSTHLEAADSNLKIGKNDTVFQFADTSWNGVYFTIKGLSLTAALPNYDEAEVDLGSNTFFLFGEVEEADYTIKVILRNTETDFTSQENFSEFILQFNPDYTASSINPQPFGAKYILDMIPNDEYAEEYVRFIVTPYSIIQMETDDTNENRRETFFNSIKIK